MVEQQDSLVGKSVSHYSVVRRLGSGGMGVVYEAEDSRLGRNVALKFLPPELARDGSSLERFQREARAASALNHPGICTVYAIEEHDGQHFIVMECLEGQTLAQTMAARPAFDLESVLSVGIQIADALESAHARGIPGGEGKRPARERSLGDAAEAGLRGEIDIVRRLGPRLRPL